MAMHTTDHCLADGRNHMTGAPKFRVTSAERALSIDRLFRCPFVVPKYKTAEDKRNVREWKVRSAKPIITTVIV
jgi:hypothetical protein